MSTQLDKATAFAKEFLGRDILLDDCKSHPPTDANLAHIGESLQQAAVDPDTNDYDVLVALAAEMQGQNPPEWLSTFAADVLRGKRKRPTKRGADKYTNWPRDYRLWRASQEVHNQFNLPLYAENSTAITAAEVVSKASGEGHVAVVNAIKRFNRLGAE